MSGVMCNPLRSTTTGFPVALWATATITSTKTGVETEEVAVQVGFG